MCVVPMQNEQYEKSSVMVHRLIRSGGSIIYWSCRLQEQIFEVGTCRQKLGECKKQFLLVVKQHHSKSIEQTISESECANSGSKGMPPFPRNKFVSQTTVLGILRSYVSTNFEPINLIK